ncbi:hypothetical protein D3C71_1453860 [compost metagenome]
MGHCRALQRAPVQEVLWEATGLHRGGLGGGPGPLRGQQTLASLCLGHRTQKQPMPRGPPGGDGRQARQRAGLEFQLQFADAGLFLLRRAAMGDDPAGVQSQLHHTALEGDVPCHAVHLGAVGFGQRAAGGLQSTQQPCARHGACVQLRLGLWGGACGVAPVHVVLLAVQRSVAQGLDGLHPLVALAAQPKSNATRRQRCIGRIEVAGLHTDVRVCSPARGGLHRSQALWGDAELELDFHEDGAW